jgi:hypothetical protein
MKWKGRNNVETVGIVIGKIFKMNMNTIKYFLLPNSLIEMKYI